MFGHIEWQILTENTVLTKVSLVFRALVFLSIPLQIMHYIHQEPDVCEYISECSMI